MAEESLDGGITNAGKVFRVGPHVVRPQTPYSAAVHRFLHFLADQGFRGAPKPIGLDGDGHERLEFIEGAVPASPYPDWSQTDVALASIARLLRGFHDAARGFDPDSFDWPDELADPTGGRLVCHNDVELSNVVFRDGIAVALIDFEFASPGRAVYDVAQFARLCVPIEHDSDQERMGWHPADGPARLRLIADAYGFDASGRAELLAALEDAINRIEATARRNFERGGPLAASVSAATGGIKKYDRRRAWWSQRRESFAAALG